MNEKAMTTGKVIEAIERERARLKAAIDALGDAATTLPVTEEGWTAKDVLAHLTHWEGQVAFGLGAKIEPPEYLEQVTGRPTGDQWNALVVRFYKDGTFADLLARHDHIVDLIVDSASLRTDAEMNAIGAIAWAPGHPLWRFIGGDTFLHWPQHSEALEAAAALQPKQ
jgi:hypothetical protein